MINILPKLEDAFSFLNFRSAKDDDLLSFCDSRGIEVVFSHEITSGCYVLANGEHFIFLNSKLSGWRLLYVFAHEIGHYLFHYPSQSNYRANFTDGRTREKNHFEAETVAALLLLPMHEAEWLLKEDYEPSGELSELIKFRLNLAATHGV